jgi:CelD/BcsL family acetyltransferase involved in cellulose biosynthesis
VDIHTGGLEILDTLTDEWRELLQQVAADDLYSRPEWLVAHLRAYSPKAKMAALTLRQHGILGAIFPLVLEKGTFGGLPARKLRMPLSVPGACNELMMAPDMDQVTALRAIWDELGRLTLRKFQKADPAVLQRFYELEASGWKGQEKSAILCDPRSQRFFDNVAKEAEILGYLALYFLELDGNAISAHFGLNYRGCYYAPKIAYDEKYRQYRVGHLIVSKILRDCAKDGNLGIRHGSPGRVENGMDQKITHQDLPVHF